ncbi:unnamed protein product [Gongylonema pulchrum]|uniref:Maelstrom domain-containing protein n=1 Tax=Gongylonema pulchrum TaxID=637853 RepID=A0A183CZY1_9BILA|nr:unnamed protein product [Gongylonema pulchrum]
MTRISGSCQDQNDIIQNVCQIYQTVESERAFPRRTALIRHSSPLHPFSICNPNFDGHEQCIPFVLDYVPSGLAPPTMAHHYYYMLVRNAQIPGSLKDTVYRELYDTAPPHLSTKYEQLQNRFGLAPPNDCRMLMFAVLDFWIQRCRLVKFCLDATMLLPIRLEWVNPIFEGTRFRPSSAANKVWECGTEVDEYGWAVEMIRAERMLAFTENCPLIFIGDNTSGRLVRYLEWGKRLGDFEGRFRRRFENAEFPFMECERMSVLARMLQKIHFGNGCLAVVLTSGAHELAENMAPRKYAELLDTVLAYLMQFQLRIIVTPPTPCTRNASLWLRYVEEQRELCSKFTEIEFLVAPNLRAGDERRSFLDALLMGSHSMDEYTCDSGTGFTDYGIKKLSFFLVEVLHIPKTETNEYSRGNGRSMGRAAQYDEYHGAANRFHMINKPSKMRFTEAQKQGWFPPSLDYEPLDDGPSSYGFENSRRNFTASERAFEQATKYSGLAGYGPYADLPPNLLPKRRRRKKTEKMEEAETEAGPGPYELSYRSSSKARRERRIRARARAAAIVGE